MPNTLDSGTGTFTPAAPGINYPGTAPTAVGGNTTATITAGGLPYNSANYGAGNVLNSVKAIYWPTATGSRATGTTTAAVLLNSTITGTQSCTFNLTGLTNGIAYSFVVFGEVTASG